MPSSEYFSHNYAAAHERFRSVAGRAGATLASYVLPKHRGPKREALAIDVAHIGNADADSALILISGTHGVEGLCGSGCQVGFFEDQLYEALSDSACALLIHALNPYGFAWLRRVNEDGVDVNRNFVDFSLPLPSSPEYDRLHDWLVPTDWDGEGRRQADLALAEFVRSHSMKGLQDAVQGGQYTQPLGLFYGGSGPTWSALRLIEILQTRLPRSVRRVAVLDLHTGLGPPGFGEPILFARSEADHERAQRWYGKEIRNLAAGDDSVSAQVVGAVPEGIIAALPNIELTYLALEFGTLPLSQVLTALRADHWLYAHGTADLSLRDAIPLKMREAFFCQNAAWQAAVYGRAADFMFRACRGLS